MISKLYPNSTASEREYRYSPVIQYLQSILVQLYTWGGLKLVEVSLVNNFVHLSLGVLNGLQNVGVGLGVGDGVADTDTMTLNKQPVVNHSLK